MQYLETGVWMTATRSHRSRPKSTIRGKQLRDLAQPLRELTGPSHRTLRFGPYYEPFTHFCEGTKSAISDPYDG